MPACIHGDVCREWMRRMDKGVPLSSVCPNGCIYFQAKRDPQNNGYGAYYTSRSSSCPYCGMWLSISARPYSY